MIRDIMTVMWKEWRDMPAQGGQATSSPLRALFGVRKSGVIGQLFFLGMLGVFLPLQTGPTFLSSGIVVGFMVWAPFVLTMALSADAFAGERERKTLETLLASRLSDRAILFGKMLTLVAYAWARSIMIMLLALVTVNVSAGHGKLLMYPLPVLIGGPIVALLATVLLSGLGVIASLRASTVRQATQSMSLIFIVMFLIPVLLRVLPVSMTTHAMSWLAGLHLSGVIALVALVFLLLNLIVIPIAIVRFQRPKLILD